METLSWRDKMKKSKSLNAIALYLLGVISLAIVAYGCKALLSLL